MEEHVAIHEQVAEAYAKAVKTPSRASCCSGDAVPKGVAANLAGYTRKELEDLPPDSVVNSFGCGNPLAFSGVEQGDVVLDLGSGAGIDILLAGKMVGPEGQAIGIDMTDEMIARARENIAAAGLDNVEVRKGLIEELPVEDNTVDWVISNCVINLSPDKPRVFSEIERVLKPGGRIRISDLVADELPEWIREDPRFYNNCIAGAINEKEYLKGLAAAGLDDVKVVDKLTYESAQIQALADSELSGEEPDSPGVDEDFVKRFAEDLDGRVHSITVTAVKHGSGKREPS